MQGGRFLFIESVARYIKHKAHDSVLTRQTQLKFVFMTINRETQ